MKPSKTAKTLLIAAVGLIGSAVIAIGSALILSRLAEKAELTEGDARLTAAVNTLTTGGGVTECQSVTVSETDGSVTELRAQREEGQTLLRLTVTGADGAPLSSVEKAVDATLWEQLTAIVEAYALTDYAEKVEASSAAEVEAISGGYIAFTYKRTAWRVAFSALDEKALPAAEAIESALLSYMD